MVCPGATETALLHEVMDKQPKLLDAMKRNIPMRRTGKPEDLAGAVAFFASADADYATGQAHPSVSGGLTMAG